MSCCSTVVPDAAELHLKRVILKSDLLAVEVEATRAVVPCPDVGGPPRGDIATLFANSSRSFSHLPIRLIREGFPTASSNSTRNTASGAERFPESQSACYQD